MSGAQNIGQIMRGQTSSRNEGRGTVGTLIDEAYQGLVILPAWVYSMLGLIVTIVLMVLVSDMPGLSAFAVTLFVIFGMASLIRRGGGGTRSGLREEVE